MSSDDSLKVLPWPPNGWPDLSSDFIPSSWARVFRGESSHSLLGLTHGVVLRSSETSVPSESDFSLSDSDTSGCQFDSGSCYTVSAGELMAREQAELSLVPRWVDKYSLVAPEVLGMTSIYRSDAPVPILHLPLGPGSANEEVANVPSRVNFTRHLQEVEQQCLQQAAFMKYLRGIVMPHFHGVQSSNKDLEKEETRLKASVKLVGKEMKAYKEFVGREGACREVQRVVIDVDKLAVMTLIKKNLARHQAKWDEEGKKLIAIGNNLVKESFENALAQLSLKKALVRDRVSHEFEVFRDQICKVDTLAHKLINVDSGEEVVDWDREGKYRNGEK
ncbi:putative rootletin-like [Sesbania bispinosa]|nr:putative rootletin-like [Sesbania bispinosa]